MTTNFFVVKTDNMEQMRYQIQIYLSHRMPASFHFFFCFARSFLSQFNYKLYFFFESTRMKKTKNGGEKKNLVYKYAAEVLGSDKE